MHRETSCHLSLSLSIYTGRQLFERNRQLDTSDAALVEEGSVSVDVSQYERTGPIEEEQEEERLALSDSDDD